MSLMGAVPVVGDGFSAGRLGMRAGSHGAVYSVSEKISQTIASIRESGLKDAHHIIQDAAVKNLPNYNSKLATWD
jgi:hypothetical protein